MARVPLTIIDIIAPTAAVAERVLRRRHRTARSPSGRRGDRAFSSTRAAVGLYTATANRGAASVALVAAAAAVAVATATGLLRRRRRRSRGLAGRYTNEAAANDRNFSTVFSAPFLRKRRPRRR